MSPSNLSPKTLTESDFMRLFVQHELALRAYARSILPTWNAVDDAIQEASVTMWQKFSQLDTEDGFLPWAKVIVRFKCLSLITKYRRDLCLFSDEMLQQIADEAEAIQSEQVTSIRSSLKICMQQFTQPHQELLLAPYLAGGQVQKIADDCGKSVNAIYKLLGRLRQKLSACIERRLQAEA
ncbi:sigma-70 family RNA polymerase sigma factor [Rhodopirellula sp. JC740]|uniref:Sigma-70 family RNA polymerase sigma factor n=1 Tax=Rhodopirellula halodulae TaxID=2894198 RepID=A0ABS8NEW9_9BACT|nr:sigma-70 family RNA polymerase sigma factor [Rhodopirellula sp. JC740]MCC9642078.1 sigma-70 family RNA polymerase sigma factor [Rhodopirellula sp. JC740]